MVSVAAQCAALQQLKGVSLLVGRGVGEETRWWTKPVPTKNGGEASSLANDTRGTDVERDSSSAFIPTDIFGGAFSTAPEAIDGRAAQLPPPHLWMSFTNINDLQHIATGSVSRIVFDYSTWRYMKLSPPVLREWARILIPDGWLAFDAGIASVRWDSSAPSGTVGWDCENPTHCVVADRDTWEAVVTSLGKKNKALSLPLPAKTTVLPAPTAAPVRSHPLLEALAAAYTELFMASGFDPPLLIQDEDYPARTRGHMQPWFKVVKRTSQN
ncbi:hypothetical protein HDU86_001599 [Geranomyces michiganensis]|nr:hypothetical protein HDU86_001599 [Geranomyces michiganensis]